MIDYAQIEKWGVAVATLKHWKDMEAKLRREICEEIFDGETGKFNKLVNIEGEDVAVKVKAFSVTNLSVDEAKLTALYEAGELSKDDSACFETKLAIKEGLLRKRPIDSPVWRAVMEKPGMPKLEVTKL